jgi:hypothetical protein
MTDAEILAYLQTKVVRSQAVPNTWWLHFFGSHADLRKSVEQRVKREREESDGRQVGKG